MFNKDPKSHYNKLLSQITSAISQETNLITLTATISALIHESINILKDNKVNWTGFYFLESDGGLVVGPYQGKMACQRIPKGKGVCGSAVTKKQCVIITDVHQCEEHIACDSNSKSEIVFPIIVNNEVMGVLDIDSLVTSGFNEDDKTGLENIINLIQTKCQWNQLIKTTTENTYSTSSTFPFLWIIPVALTVLLGAFTFGNTLLRNK